MIVAQALISGSTLAFQAQMRRASAEGRVHRNVCAGPRACAADSRSGTGADDQQIAL